MTIREDGRSRTASDHKSARSGFTKPHPVIYAGLETAALEPNSISNNKLGVLVTVYKEASVTIMPTLPLRISDEAN